VTGLVELVDAADVDVVLNLTVPAAHAKVTLTALSAGKHVYGEKPLAMTTTQAREIAVVVARRAAAEGPRVGCAPDTVLGTGLQTARAVVDRGAIGVPHAATAFMTTPGHERWHPDPEFYYRPGGGPLLDMGPYYLTALVHLLGPVARVVGLSSRRSATRVVGSGPRAGAEFRVEVDTHVTGVLEHVGGAMTTLVMSFDVWAARLPRIELHGSTGSLSVPDPNHFAGDVEIFTEAEPQWQVVAPSDGYVGAGRGVGLVELAAAVHAGRPHRAALDVAVHVVDVMDCLLRATSTGTAVDVGSTCERPAPVTGLIEPASLV
jgi:predicted dehydrogenase